MYSKLNEIYSKTRVDVFVMALGYLIEKGTSNIAEITDDEINEIDGNGFMTKEFSQMLVKLARDIAKKIEDELDYPGQIKVTVVREFRTTEIAK